LIGSETPLKILEVGGIAGSYNIALESKTQDRVTLARQIRLVYSSLDGEVLILGKGIEPKIPYRNCS
jgi:hypothetical protein